MRNTLFCAKIVHHSLAIKAKVCFEGAMAIVEACMNDLDSRSNLLVHRNLHGFCEHYLGVSTAGLLTDRAMSLDQNSCRPVSGSQLAGNCKPHHTSANYLSVLHVSISAVRLA